MKTDVDKKSFESGFVAAFTASCMDLLPISPVVTQCSELATRISTAEFEAVLDRCYQTALEMKAERMGEKT